jgi:signal transduction histidine kinase/ligand-binding sensor domain-containing protein
MNKLVIPFILLFFSGVAFGQGNETGYPFIKNFTTAEYKAHAQNFAIVSDHSGILYFGNFAGVLQYDGEFWRLIPTKNTTKVSALATDSSGRIYVGGMGEIGILQSGPRGDLQFVSLIDSATAAQNPFQEVLKIFSTKDGVYFLTRSVIFKWFNGIISTLKHNHEIISAFYVNNKLYFQDKGKGLMFFEDEKISAVRNGEMVSGAIEIRAMLPYSGDQILIATGTQGLFLLDAQGVRDFITESDDLFMQNLITSGIYLSDGSYAIGTSRQGIIVIDPDGKIKQIIDKKASLRNDYIQALYADDNQTLWAALNNGIAMIDAPSPLTFFDEKSGLNGAVNNISRFNDRLFVSTYQGLYYFNEGSFGFLPVPGILTASWCAVPVGKNLFAATSQGLFNIIGSRGKILKEGFVMSMVSASDNPNRLYLGEMGGLYCFDYQSGSGRMQKLAGHEDEINDLIEDGYHNIWGSTLTKGIFRYSPLSDKVDFFSEKEGLPDNVGSTINLIGKSMSVSTRQGVFVYQENEGSFKKINLIKPDSSSVNQWYSIITESARGDLWVNSGDESDLTLLKKSGDFYEPYQTPFLPISDYIIWAIYPEPNGVTWFGGPDGLIRYDPAVDAKNIVPHPTMIRRIISNNDSVVFYGGSEKTNRKTSSAAPEIFRYKDNSLRFEYACPYFSPKGENQYQYILEGFDETWSDWSAQNHKEYTNLPKGTYTFRVKARNIYKIAAQEATFSFRILSPWYTTFWAYIIYTLLAGGLIYLILIIRNRQLLKEKRVLEQRIADRTAEVVQQKEEIEQQSDELASKNDELEKINATVKSINSEIKFENLLQSLLEKMRIIKSVEKSTALVFDKSINAFRFKASFGWETTLFDDLKLTLNEAEERYLKDAEEVYEDLFLKTDFSSMERLSIVGRLPVPKSMLVLVIKVENKVEAFLILENISREHAFEAKDMSFIRNSKEHIISAFIRTRILEDLQNTLQNLKDTQDQLVQSEKLASLGALTAGIAHEIQNPLNFVNNFSSLSADLADELTDFLNEIKDQISPEKYADVEEILGMVKGNVKKINEHGKRAESIVKGMLQHSRGKTGEFEQIEINNMVSEYVNLAYHGMRAKDKSFNTSIKTQLDPEVGKASIIPQDLSRVILNIVNNACYALDEKAKKHIAGFSPEVMITTKKLNDKIEIRIRDNGTGIPDHVREKIFNPFFTTKPTGKGTGLGLSMSYDIVTQLHKGKLEVFSQEGAFTEFVITIPEKQS